MYIVKCFIQVKLPLITLLNFNIFIWFVALVYVYKILYEDYKEDKAKYLAIPILG